MEAMTSEREAFEKWMGRVHPSFPLSYHQGAYVLSSVRDLWNAFSAGRAHLAQPAQAVDVGVIREVIATLEADGDEHGVADKLTRALAGEKAEGWRERAERLLRDLEFSALGGRRCPCCLGWNNESGETDKTHTATCELAALLSGLPTPPTDGEE